MREYNRNHEKILDITDIVDGIDEYYFDDFINDQNDHDIESEKNWKDHINPIKSVLISDNDTATRIHKQYENAISRTSTYVGNLYNHILSHSGEVIFDSDNDSAIVGQSIEIDGIFFFVVSHFAPLNLRSGVKFIKQLNRMSYPIIIAVPDYQSQQLSKAGFRKIGSIPQYFAGDYVSKNIMVNDYTSNNHINLLMKHYMS